MSQLPNTIDAGLHPPAVEWIDSLADRFEAAWRDGRRPSISEYLAAANAAERSPLLDELIKLDLEYRCRSGEDCRVEHYLTEYPELQTAGGILPDHLVLHARSVRGRFSTVVETPYDLSDRPSTLSRIRTLGKFQLLELVGHGSFGAVYRARDSELRRTVAVKIAHRSQVASPRQRERFLREASHAAQLDHPHIVRVYEVAHEGDMAYIVCGFIEGRTLAAQIADQPHGPRQAAELAVEIADALDYAHRRRIVHCDVNPRNILIDGAGRAHLADFGLARRDEPDVAATLDGQVAGTPAYMPPEQAAGQRASVDGRSDIYSLGVVLYELLTGERPFRGNVRMVLYQVLNEEPSPPRRLNDRIPRDLETICLKAMAKSPGGRYATAGELAADLRRFLKGEPIKARPAGRLEIAGRWCRRNRLPAALLASVALLLAMLVSGLVWEVVRIAQAREATERRLARERELLAHAQAGRGVLKLDADNADGLLDLVDARATAETAGQAKKSYERLWSAWYPACADRLAQLVSHDQAVLAAAFSPDGRLIATTSHDGAVQLWDAATGLPRGPPLANNPDASRLDFGPARTFLVTRPTQTTIGFWSTQSGHARWPTIACESGISHLQVSPDGHWLAACVSPGEVRLWHLSRQPTARGSFSHDNLWTMRFSADGRWLATACGQGTVKLWSTSGERIEWSIEAHPKAVRDLAFNAEGTLLATAAWDHTARLWDVETGKARSPPLKHGEDVHALCFDPSGTLLATGSFDGAARLWQVADARLLHTLAHEGPVSTVAFSCDGVWLASGSSDATARVWRVDTGKPHGWPLRPLAGVTSVAFHPTLSKLLTASLDGTARVWNLSAEAPVALPHGNRVWSVAFSPDGKRLITASEDGLAQVWDTRLATRIGEPLIQPDAPRAPQMLSVSYSPDGRLFATAGNNSAQLWDAHTMRPHGPPFDHPLIRVVAFSADGTTLATGGFDNTTHQGTALLWDCATGRRRGQAIEHQGVVYRLAFSPDGQLLATHSAGTAVYLWKTSTQQSQRQPLMNAAEVAALAFSPDGRRLVTSSADLGVRLWSLADGQSQTLALQQTSKITALAFSPDGALLATGTTDGKAQIWDLATGLACGPPVVHQMQVAAVAFSPDGRLLATGSFDTTARLTKVAAAAVDLDEMQLRTSLALATRIDGDGMKHALDWRAWQAARQNIRQNMGPTNDER